MSDAVRPEDLEALLAQFRASDLNELHLKTPGFELFLSNDADAAAPWDAGSGASPALTTPARASAPKAAATPATKSAASAKTATAASPPVDIPAGMTVVRAPYLGHFYRAPKPGERNFCEIGDTVAAGADLCLVEVMKLFTAVRAEVGGKVAHVYAVDGQMVEEGQPLFAIEATA